MCRLSWGIAMTPDDDTDIRLTAESARIVATGERIFRRSQTFTLRSSELETTLSSRRVNTADVTLLEKQIMSRNWLKCNVFFLLKIQQRMQIKLL